MGRFKEWLLIQEDYTQGIGVIGNEPDPEENGLRRQQGHRPVTLRSPHAEKLFLGNKKNLKKMKKG
jgi:hypothetical protein